MIKPHLVHIYPTFAVGGAQTVATRLINALGGKYRHTIISLDGRFQAVERLMAGLDVICESHAGKGGIIHAWRSLKRLRPDLILTCNWGSFDWVVAAALRRSGVHFHQEHGFGLDEAIERSRRRNRARKLVLPFARGVIVPSRSLARLARCEWGLPEERIIYLANGVDRARIESRTVDASFDDRSLVIGTVAPLRQEKRIDLMIDAFARLRVRTDIGGLPVRLAIVGDGQERTRLHALAESYGLQDRVTFLGHQDLPEKSIATFDIYAISSATEQLPMAVLEAMALGKPVAGFDVGDVKYMLAPDNAPYIVAPGDQTALSSAMDALIRDPDARGRVGRANARRQRQAFDENAMITHYQDLFAQVLA